MRPFQWERTAVESLNFLTLWSRACRGWSVVGGR